LQVFISYRRTDAQSAARQLAEALKLRFGSVHVFFDTRDIPAGTEWWEETRERLKAAARSSAGQERPKARAAHRPNKSHVNASPQHTAGRGTDWTVVDSCEFTETRVWHGIVDVEDLVLNKRFTVTPKNSPRITRAR
jgi:hypothetical protein